MQRGRRSRLLVVVALIASALLVAPVATRSQTSEPPVAATVSGTPASQPMPRGFLGVSLEYNALHIYTGRDPKDVDPVLIQLLRNLAPGQTPVVRIGGNSADFSWFPIKGTQPPVGVHYALTNGWVRMTRAFAAALGARLIMGVNLAGGRPAIAAAEARAFLRGIGTRYLQALEVGNEPDLYNFATWFTDRHGRKFTARPPTYDFDSYLSDFARWRSVLPPVPLIGPALATLTWLNNMDEILAADPGTKVVTAHRYALRACPTPTTSPLFATVPNLLADRSSAGLAQGVAPYVAMAHARGVQFRLDELNSVACSGKAGVSDTFASGLWMLDTLFNMAGVGVDAINVHSLPGSKYELFTISHRKDRWQAFVHPDYYAMLMFEQAFPPGAQLLQVSEPDGPVKVWATRANDGRQRIVIINKDATEAQTVQVSVPGAGGVASLDWLKAPNMLATNDVTLGNESFGEDTRSGLLRPAHPDPITATAGTYTVELPAASAVLLTQ